ncbi:MAG: hypothetical protein WB735_01910, partial [Pseudonocardiaceae bacterium]
HAHAHAHAPTHTHAAAHAHAHAKYPCSRLRQWRGDRHPRVQIARNVNATVISLDAAPDGYAEFDSGVPKKIRPRPKRYARRRADRPCGGNFRLAGRRAGHRPAILVR